MGSPASAVIAELVMQEVEEIAITTAPVELKWWNRYVYRFVISFDDIS